MIEKCTEIAEIMLEKWKIWHADIIKASKSKGKEVKTDAGDKVGKSVHKA